MRHSRITTQSLLISLVIHGIIILILGTYLVYTQSPPVKEWISNVFLKTLKSDEPKKRQDNIKPVVKPTIPTEQPMIITSTELTPRVTTIAIISTPTMVDAGEVLEFDNTTSVKTARISVASNAHEPKITQGFITYANIPASTSPGGISPSASGGGGGFWSAGFGSAPLIKRGFAGSQIRTAQGSLKPSVLSMIKEIKETIIADTGLANVSQSVILGKKKVAPLLKGEPGGHVIGRGKDIEGVLRFARIQHELSDWWTDPSSLTGLAEWMNTQTKIKTDMNVEGGSIRLTDPKLLKSPIVFFTGHDPNSAYARSLQSQAIHTKGNLSEQEREGLRKYLIEKGGFLFFDDSGFTQLLTAVMVGQLRYVLPENVVERIPSDHEIYNNYYSMGGPPTGYDIYRWLGTRPPFYNYLEGITIGDHLGVLVSRKDYLCSMETVSLPSKVNHYSPAAYRFCVNTVIYALTHGGISDYSRYSPENNIADKIPFDKPIPIQSLK